MIEKKVNFTFKLPVSVRTAVAEQAKKEERSSAQIVLRAIRDYLNKHQNV